MLAIAEGDDMGERSRIEWTDATWNPSTGCTEVSAGCDHCYASTLAHGRLHALYTARVPVVDTPENRADPFAVRLWPHRLEDPARWSQPRMIFVNSMSDLFHVDIPEDFLREIFRVMLEVDRHVYQVLTKRPSRAARFWKRNQDLFGGNPIPNHIWIGTSVEDQRVAHRTEQLRAIPAKVRFISCEPLLGPLQLDLDDIHWVIVGGESGLDFRPFEPEWAISIREQCKQAGVPFFFKQVGGRTPKAGGRLLENREWNGMPYALRAHFDGCMSLTRH